MISDLQNDHRGCLVSVLPVFHFGFPFSWMGTVWQRQAPDTRKLFWIGGQK